MLLRYFVKLVCPCKKVLKDPTSLIIRESPELKVLEAAKDALGDQVVEVVPHAVAQSFQWEI